MIEEIKVLRVECDDCHTAFAFEDGAITVHFKPGDDIVKELTDGNWTVVDGSHLCETCTCGRDGHKMETYGRYRSCKCGKKYESVNTVHDSQGRL